MLPETRNGNATKKKKMIQETKSRGFSYKRHKLYTHFEGRENHFRVPQ
jgi:hypothetical protein